MANTKWNKLNRLQLGKYAEYYAKMEFASYGLDVYTSEVDDHGVDFIVKDKKGIFNEIQVKSLRIDKNNLIYMEQDKFNINNKALYLVILIFKDNEMPIMYLVPAIVWSNESELFLRKDYDSSFKSKSEYRVNLSKKNIPLLEKYRFECVIESFM